MVACPPPPPRGGGGGGGGGGVPADCGARYSSGGLGELVVGWINSVD
jgi:hypothetical protein